MQRRFSGISGSLNALVVLESAVRYSSFTKAGDELSLTQPTISRHIATLEERIGRPLFQRTNNSIEPTDVARRLADAVALGLGHAESVWNDLTLPERTDEISLACTFGFADQWLLPRFDQLQQAVGETRIRVATSDWMDCLEMSRIDAAIVADLSYAPERPSLPLFPEEAFPICSPDFLRHHPQIEHDPEALRRSTLLHFDVGNSGFLNWKDWFARQGLVFRQPETSVTYDAYPFLLRAVQNGSGVGLGWRFLVDREIADGSVVKIGASAANRETAYYLQYRPETPPTDALQTLIDWFKHAATDAAVP